MDSKKFDIGEETKSFIKNEIKNIKTHLTKKSKASRKHEYYVFILTTIAMLLGISLGALIQSGVFNPQSNIDVTFQGLDKSSGRYYLYIMNKGNALSNSIDLKVTFHKNITITQNQIFCDKEYLVDKNESKENTITLRFSPLFPIDTIVLVIPFTQDGDADNNFLVYGQLVTQGEVSINLITRGISDVIIENP